MNNPQRQLLRHAILIQLEAASPASLPLETLHQGITFAGHTVQPTELAKELHYLCDKDFVTSTPQALSPGILRYKLSAPGREYLESQNLV